MKGFLSWCSDYNLGFHSHLFTLWWFRIRCRLVCFRVFVSSNSFVFRLNLKEQQRLSFLKYFSAHSSQGFAVLFISTWYVGHLTVSCSHVLKWGLRSETNGDPLLWLLRWNLFVNIYFFVVQFVKNTLNPVWKPFRIPMQSLCGGDVEKSIKVRKHGAHAATPVGTKSLQMSVKTKWCECWPMFLLGTLKVTIVPSFPSHIFEFVSLCVSFFCSHPLTLLKDQMFSSPHQKWVDCRQRPSKCSVSEKTPEVNKGQTKALDTPPFVSEENAQLSGNWPFG